MATTKTETVYSAKVYMEDNAENDVTASYSGVKSDVSAAELKAIADAMTSASAAYEKAPTKAVGCDIIETVTTTTSEEFEG